MRRAVLLALVFGGAVAVAQQFPLRQNVEILKEGPIRADRVKDGLYVIRGPFLPCMTGCRPGQTGDGLIHESGDVAVRVTPAGLIVVDDKFASQAADVLTQVKAVSSLPNIFRAFLGAVLDVISTFLGAVLKIISALTCPAICSAF